MNRWITVSLGALLLSASPVAHAATLVASYPGAPDPGPIGTVLLDFEAPIVGGQLGNGITISGQYAIFSGDSPPNAAAPAGNTGAYLAIPGAGYNGFATIDFSDYADVAGIGGFNFYWGSIDADNQLAIVTSGGTYTFNGADVISSGFGSTSSAEANQRVSFALAAGETLQAIRFFSDRPAFELDDFAILAVPEPASWGLMIAGFGLIGFTLRKRANGRQGGDRTAGVTA